MESNKCIFFKISQTISNADNKSALDQMLAWCQSGDKSLPKLIKKALTPQNHNDLMFLKYQIR